MPTRKLRPPEIARLYGVSPDKVITWIRSGELRAINIATRVGGRPRFLVDAADLAAFEIRRQSHSKMTTTQRPRRQRPADIIEFF
jgi:hypothetical protein